MDLGSGCGLGGLAAALLGAASVRFNDIDPYALEAIRWNAQATLGKGRSHGCRLIFDGTDHLTGAGPDWGGMPAPSVILVGDMSYESELAERLVELLEPLVASGATALIGDPGRAFLARDKLELVVEYPLPPDLAADNSGLTETGVWRFRGDAG